MKLTVKYIHPVRYFMTGFIIIVGLVTIISSGGGSGGGDEAPLPPQDTHPPTIINVTPANGSTDIIQQPTLDVTFSEKMDPATINDSTFLLKDISNNPVTGEVNYAASVATFTPTTGLDYSMTYTATVTTGVTDLAGNNMAADYTYSFTTIQAPQVITVTPSDGQGGVLASTEITATFNRDVDPVTLNSTTFTLTDDALNPVAGTITTSGATTTFTPTFPLDYSKTYTVTVSSDVTDTSGNTLVSDYIWDFSTISVLGRAVNIEASSDHVSCPLPIFDSSGNAYAVWVQGPNFSSESVWANRYTSASGWGTAAVIESGLADIWGCPDLAADGNGNIIAVWSQSGVIMLNRYLAGSGWGTPEVVGGSAGLYPDVAVDDNGSMFVVWQDARSIWARRYEAGVGWDTATTIESYSPDANYPSLVVDNNGNATVVWQQLVTGLLFSVTANHYTVGAGWGTPITISSGLEGILSGTVVAEIDASGHVFATWSQGPVSGIFTIRANRYVPGSGWGTPITLDTDLETSSSGAPIATALNDAIIVWGKHDKTIYAATYTNGIGWGTANEVASGSSRANVAISSTGKITVAWSHDVKNGDIWEYGTRAIQYTSGTGWGDIHLLAPNDSLSNGVSLETDGAGNFLAVWTEDAGDKLMSNLFQ